MVAAATQTFSIEAGIVPTCRLPGEHKEESRSGATGVYHTSIVCSHGSSSTASRKCVASSAKRECLCCLVETRRAGRAFSELHVSRQTNSLPAFSFFFKILGRRVRSCPYQSGVLGGTPARLVPETAEMCLACVCTATTDYTLPQTQAPWCGLDARDEARIAEGQLAAQVSPPNPCKRPRWWQSSRAGDGQGGGAVQCSQAIRGG